MDQSRYTDFFLTENYGGFLGTIPQNNSHRHLTIQISVSNQTFTTSVESEILKSQSAIIASNAIHHIDILPTQKMLLLNINPWNEIGLWCRGQLSGKSIVRGDEPFMKMLWKTAHQALSEDNRAWILERQILDHLNRFYARDLSDLRLDTRISESLQILRTSPMISANVMASHVCLSESRFLHLFKQETGLTYRRMSLWFRLYKSFRCFRDFENLTSLAYHWAGSKDL